MAKQLELFSAAIRPFPLARRRDLVIGAAQALMSRSNAAGARWWSKHTKEIAGTFLCSGIGPDATTQQIELYAQAVSRELHLMRYRSVGLPQRQSP